MLHSLGVHRTAVEHARLPHGELGDVDHLLHFTECFGQDLAVFERDQRRELLLVGSQLIGDLAHQPPARGRGHGAPPPPPHGVVLIGAADGHARDQCAVGGTEGFQRRSGRSVAYRGNVEMRQQRGNVGAHRAAQTRSARCRPGAPLKTTSPEMSLLLPAARWRPKRLSSMSGKRKDSCVTRP